jgi:hypothetical protein
MQNGDIIWRQKKTNAAFNHYGVVIDANQHRPLVAHHSSCGGASIVTLNKFLGGHTLKGTAPTPLTGATTEEMLQKFTHRADETFDIVLNNCEAWAHRTAMNGNRMKEIIKAVIYVVAFVAALKLLKII